MKKTRISDFLTATRNAISRKRARGTRTTLNGKYSRELEVLEERALMAGDLSGVVFNDLTANGVNDKTDPGLAGWTVFIDSNNDGQLTTGEPFAVTDVKGKYTIAGLPAGPVNVFEIVQTGFHPTAGLSDHQTITIRDGRVVKADFANVTAPVTTGRIVGTVFEDNNENGIKESGEHGLSGWAIFVDRNGDGLLTAGEPTATTDTDGGYSFADMPAGPTVVYEIPQAGFAPINGGLFPTAGASDHHAVAVTAGSSVHTDFANLVPPVGTIQGSVWNDVNGDGIHQLAEAPLAGQTVYIDLNNNGLQDASDPVRTTDASGAYSFVDIHTGTYRVVDVIPAGFVSADNRAAAVTTSVFRGSLNVLDFYNLQPVTGSIGGVLFDDLDGSGTRLATEPPLSGWQIFVDANLNGVLDTGEASATTAGDGSYSFVGLPYGNSTLREIVPANWIATNSTAGAITVHLLNGQSLDGLNFGNRERVGTIQGTVWNDANGDGLRGPSENGLADQIVFLDMNGDGLQDAADPSTVTDSTGSYTFTRIPVGTYSVVEVVPAGWRVSQGKSATSSITVGIGSTNVVDFYNLTPVPGSISGTVWSDLDSNGSQDPAETGLTGWQVYVDLNGNGSVDAGEPQGTTDSNGDYTLTDVPYGTTTIREIAQSGFTATSPAAITTTVLNGENRVGVNFGVHEATDYTISGTAYFDANKDGVRDPSETGVSGVTVFLDLNGNGILDAAEPTAVTSVDLFYTPSVNEIGTYSFTHLARGTYHVVEVVPASLEGTPLAARQQTVTVGPSSQTAVDFADVYRANEIHGVIFDDTNANQIHDPQEYVRPGVPVYIDLNRDDIYEEAEPRTITADDGSYAFVGLTPGAYIVREDHGGAGPHTYPTTGGGILWPEGTSNPAIGNVSPTSITASLADGEIYSQTVSLTLPQSGTLTNLVDVFLLFDDTGSFTSNSPIVRAAFPDIISTLQASLPGIDLGFGVGRFEEYANFASEFPTGRPFILNQPIVASNTPGSLAAIQAALDRVAPGYGGDLSETDIEALYQLVTGAGFDGNNNGTVTDSGAAGLASTQVNPGASGDVPSFASFTADAANGVMAPAGSVGGGGFRLGALPIVLLATDTGVAYQPQGETTITGAGGLTLPISALTQDSRPTTPFGAGAGIQQTVTGLNALGAMVIGLGTNADAAAAPRSTLEALSQLTGAVNRSTSTIANGTADAIAPGDPLYFQINTGFGASVADGVVNAIQNAVTNVAMDITVRASDPRVHVINHTGALLGVRAGQTASFDIEFTGDGRPHRFDLQFVREGTNVVLGSIPVVLGTPVAGEGYSYEELEDGEIHQSAHFGNYVANSAPSFVGGSDISVAENSAAQTVAGWASSISAGPVTEVGQSIDFVVTNDNPALFNGQPAISPDGTLTFTPAANASGSAVVTVLLHDNGGIGLSGADTSSPRSFLITLTPTNSAPTAADDNYSTTTGTGLVITAGGVLSNDIDADGDVITARLVTGPAHGNLTLNSDGSFSYLPDADFTGLDSFTYIATDGTLDSLAATVSITVNRINHSPSVADDLFLVDEDGLLNVGLSGVLANDSDQDHDDLSASLVSTTVHGTLAFSGDGTFQYIPNPNFNGTDSFTYLANDGSLDSAVATVTINVAAVNDAPVAVDDSYLAVEDTAFGVTGSGMLTNDTDADGDLLTIIPVALPAHGTLALNPDGTFQYTPSPNFNGIDRFTYLVSDGSADSNVATVTINVAPVNDAPIATGNAYNATEDTPLVIGAPGVLADDFDVDGNLLAAIRVTGPAHGTLALSANGSFVYTPALNFNGTDSFTYQASDGTATSDIATVTITVAAVNDIPVAGSNSYSTNQDVALHVAASGVLANDADADGDPLSAILATAPAHGALVLNADGSFTYTPTAGYSGTDSFTYRATDGIAQSNAASVTLTVIPFIPPTKFFVADGDRSATFQYAADGSPITNHVLNKSDSKPRGIASNSSGTIQWVIDGSGTVFVYDNLGNTLGQWQPQGVGKPEGITVWGNDLWIVDPNQDKVFKFVGGANLRTGKANPTSSFSLNSGNLNSTDLVTDGSHIWVLNDTAASDKVFRYTTGGLLEGSWTISAADPTPTGITLDPADVNHLWIVDASTDRIYQYDGATARLSGSQEASVSFALATTDTNPQGIADPPTSNLKTSAPVSLLDQVMAELGSTSNPTPLIARKHSHHEHHHHEHHHEHGGTHRDLQQEVADDSRHRLADDASQEQKHGKLTEAETRDNLFQDMTSRHRHHQRHSGKRGL